MNSLRRVGMAATAKLYCLPHDATQRHAFSVQHECRLRANEDPSIATSQSSSLVSHCPPPAVESWVPSVPSVVPFVALRPAPGTMGCAPGGSVPAGRLASSLFLEPWRLLGSGATVTDRATKRLQLPLRAQCSGQWQTRPCHFARPPPWISKSIPANCSVPVQEAHAAAMPNRPSCATWPSLPRAPKPPNRRRGRSS